jgi:hypothetical protein
MIIVTLNVRGVGGAPKFLSLKIFLALVKRIYILIQETMVNTSKQGRCLLNFFHRGISVGWIP